ncbi:MAG: hypothetical protein R2798_11895 [Chitinophagales bacterium]|nr:hypothetical protein [Bacteroidota bacterium]MCB9043602.1 hypothetical protein [Chitinophagales bacterium]
MQIKFQKISYSAEGLEPIYQYGVDLDSLLDKELSLQHLESYLWTPEKIQDLIDESLALQEDEEIEYQVDGGHLFMIIDKNEVFFYNSLENKKEEDFIWPLAQFIEFLQDFKKFVEENS